MTEIGVTMVDGKGFLRDLVRDRGREVCGRGGGRKGVRGRLINSTI